MTRYAYRAQDHAFGKTMLTLRTNIGLTQAGLAQLLGVSRRSITEWETGSKYPKAKHLQAFIGLAVQHRAFLAGQEIDEIRALWKAAHQRVLLDEDWVASLLSPAPSAESQAMAAVSAVDAPQIRDQRNFGFPFQATSFVGREDELTKIARVLQDPACRLLTLLGPGGVGKTRLALEAAGHTAVYADGVAFVSLASISTPAQIVSAIGNTLQLSFGNDTDLTAHLIAYLRERHVLLILDNFEHLLSGAGLVNDILQQAPHVTIIVTSQSRLNLQSEWLLDVGGLAYPIGDIPAASQTLNDLAEYSAVQLFVQRAVQVQPRFSPSEVAIQSIVRMSQQLAGMPLAIELAAASVRMHAVDMIEQQIRENLGILSTKLRDVPERHRSLRAAFDYSWSLLTEPERRLFSRLAIFKGSFTAEAAQRVTGATLYDLESLIDKSLLRQSVEASGTSAARFMMLEPIREYALEQLASEGDIEALQRTHAHYYIVLAEAAEAEWLTPQANEAMNRLGNELDNLRAVLQWAYDSGSSTPGLQLAGTLWHFWRVRGYITEGRAWLAGLLAQDEANPDPAGHAVRLRALYGAAFLATDQHDFAGAEQLIEQRMELLRFLGQNEDETSLRTNMALEARAVGEYQRATRLLEETLARYRAQNNRGSLATGGLGVSLYFLALMLREQGDFARAETLFKECVDFHTEIGERTGAAQGLLGLSDIARDQGDITQLRSYCERSLAIFREFGTQWAIGFGLNNLAQAAYLEGDLAQAFGLTQESLSLFRSLHADASLAEVLITLGHTLREQGALDEAREALTEALRLAWIHGSRLIVVKAAEGLASVEVQQGQMTQALPLLGAASALRTQMGTPVQMADQPMIEQMYDTLRTAVGDDAFEITWTEAQRLPLEQIASYGKQE